MAAYLGLDIFIVATINLVIQTVAYALLIIGFNFARKNNYSMHGRMQISATTLNLISLLLVMLPTFYSILTGVSFLNIDINSTITIVHHSLGLIALIMAVIAIVVLRPCGSIRGKKKLGNVRWYMIALFIIWTIAYIYGIVIHLIFYHGLIL